MIKSIVIALAALGGTIGAGTAHAGVSWSVGVNVPLVGAVVGNAPVYRPYYAPAYGAPAYAPAPAYAAAPVYVPAPVYAPASAYYPAPVAYYPPYRYYGAPVVYGYRHDGWGYGDHGYHGYHGHPGYRR
jgi:hypothetical protein